MKHVSNKEKTRTQMLLEYEKQQNAMMIAQNEFAKTSPYLNSEMGQYAFQLGFEEGVKFTKNQFIDRLEDWLANNICNAHNFRGDNISATFMNDCIKAMKGE